MESDAEKAVLSVLADYGSLSSMEIMSLTSIPDEAVRQAIDSLARKKLVTLAGERIGGNLAVTIQQKGVTLAYQFSKADQYSKAG